ncbi:TPA: hypothetical protein ACT1UY_001268 [Raoultella planticola]
MNIETVNELIQSLESAGELSIREQKFLKLAKAYQQLAAENVALKTAHPQPFGQGMMKALDAYEKHQDDVPETGMLDAFFILRDSIRVETPATSTYLAGIKADTAAPLVSALTVIANSEQISGETVVCDFDSLISVAAGALRDYYAQQLREGAK